MKPCSQTPALRKGAVVVEFAVILPVVLLIALGTLEAGRATTVTYNLQEAARGACRMATLQGSTLEDLEELADASLSVCGVSDYTLTVTPTDFQSAVEGDPVTVTISTSGASVSWLNSMYFSDKTLVGTCTMRVAQRPEPDTDPPANGKKGAKKQKKSKKTNKKGDYTKWKKNKKV